MTLSRTFQRRDGPRVLSDFWDNMTFVLTPRVVALRGASLRLGQRGAGGRDGSPGRAGLSAKQDDALGCGRGAARQPVDPPAMRASQERPPKDSLQVVYAGSIQASEPGNICWCSHEERGQEVRHPSPLSGLIAGGMDSKREISAASLLATW